MPDGSMVYDEVPGGAVDIVRPYSLPGGSGLAGMAERAVRGVQNAAPATPDGQAAQITREQWDRFRSFYAPLEQRVLKEAMRTNFDEEANKASLGVRAASRVGQGITARQVRRQSGGSLTAEEQAAVDRRNRTQTSEVAAGAENTTRRQFADSRQSMLAQAVSIGRGVSQTASTGLNNAAQLAQQRDLQYEQQKAQYESTLISSGGTAAALLFAI